MSLIYRITVTPAEQKDYFRISWLNTETNEVDSFEQPARKIINAVSHDLWQQKMNHAELGERLFQFLDGSPGCLMRAMNRAEKKDRLFQLHICTSNETADWPFELLAKKGCFLAAKHLHLVRSIPRWVETQSQSPENRPLKILFMASSAMNVEPELDFEQEEETIFQVVRDLPVDIEVEDSGSLEGLRERLFKEQYDVVHLSGHTDIDKNGNPFFIMEDETGCRRDIGCTELWHKALIKKPPRLLFLSGSRTGQTPDNAAAVSFSRMLVETYDLSAVLGWGRCVSNPEAIHAGKVLLHELSRGRSLLKAVQRTRYELIKHFSSLESPAWPLLRLFCRGNPENAVVTGKIRKKPPPRQMVHTYLKHGRMKVLTEGFVGRRRQLQQSLKTLKYNSGKVGLLIHGTGGLGKTCLAGKIYERLHDHWSVVVNGRLNSVALRDALKDAFIASQDNKGKDILAEKKEMTEKFAKLCVTSFKEKNYLFIFDDFEQNLESAKEGKPGNLLPETSALMMVLLNYLSLSAKKTQVLITCRYLFSLPVNGRDLVAERLETVALTSFRAAELHKKNSTLTNIHNHEDSEVKEKLLAAGCGNPRLMEWVDRLVGEMAETEVPKLLAAAAGKQEEFIRKHVIRQLLVRGGEKMAQFLRWFAIYRIPVFLTGVRQVGEAVDPDKWDTLLQRSVMLGLAEHNQVQDTYQVTPLLCGALVNELDPGDIRTCHEAAYNYYNKLYAKHDRFEAAEVEEWVFHALGCEKEEVASLQGGQLVSYLRENVALHESRRVGQWVLSEKKKELCTEDDAFLLNEFAATIDDLCNHHQAIGYYELALKIDRSIFGKRHPATAMHFNNLGTAWSSLGDARKALCYYEKALKIDLAVLGDGHPNVAVRLQNLGTAKLSLGEFENGIDLFEQALTIWKANYGEKDPDSAAMILSIGQAWKLLGNTRKAIGYFEQALKIWKESYGDKHHMVAVALDNLGKAWDELGKHREAIGFYTQVLNIDRRVFGERHPNVAIRLNNLALAWSRFGDAREAISYYEQALSIDRSVFGENHPEVAIRLNNLGEAWDNLNNHRQAIQYYTQALNRWREIYGETDQHVAIALNNLGEAWRGLGKTRKAITYHDQALSIYRAVFGERHPDVAVALNNLGLAWNELGEHRQAIIYCEQALEILKEVYGESHQNVAASLHNLGEAWRHFGELKKAIDYYEQALNTRKEIFGERHQTVATSLHYLGLTWTSLGDSKKAAVYYEQALEIERAVFGEMHPAVARELNNLGLAWDALGEYRQAITHYKQALNIVLKIYGEKHQKVATTFNNLGTVYLQLGQKEKAKKYLEKAYEIFIELDGPENSNSKIAANWLEELKD